MRLTSFNLTRFFKMDFGIKTKTKLTSLNLTRFLKPILEQKQNEIKVTQFDEIFEVDLGIKTKNNIY